MGVESAGYLLEFPRIFSLSFYHPFGAPDRCRSRSCKLAKISIGSWAISIVLNFLGRARVLFLIPTMLISINMRTDNSRGLYYIQPQTPNQRRI